MLVTRKDLPAKNLKEFAAYRQRARRQGDLRLGRRRLGQSPELHPARHGDRHEDHARAVPRRRPGDAGPGRRADRLQLQRRSRARCRRSTASSSTRSRCCRASACRSCRTCRPCMSRAITNFDASDLERHLPAARRTPAAIVNAAQRGDPRSDAHAGACRGAPTTSARRWSRRTAARRSTSRPSCARRSRSGARPSARRGSPDRCEFSRTSLRITLIHPSEEFAASSARLRPHRP